MRRLLACLLTCLLPLCSVPALAQTAVDLGQLQVDRVDDEIQLSAQLQFELPAAVEDALLKGIPMVFVMDADVLRERWYWYDRKVSSVRRYLRLAFQPLTRRWRLNVTSGPGSGVGLALNQSFDTLAQALAVVKRVAGWKIADATELDASVKYKVDFRFQLDLEELPRPFQMGTLGQSEWNISSEQIVVLGPESGK